MWTKCRRRSDKMVENPSSYLRYRHSTMGEANFLAELARRTGCGLLCDVNNIFVSAHNIGMDSIDYLATLPVGAVGEIHLAGHSVNTVEIRSILIDDHGSHVPARSGRCIGKPCPGLAGSRP